MEEVMEEEGMENGGEELWMDEVWGERKNQGKRVQVIKMGRKNSGKHNKKIGGMKEGRPRRRRRRRRKWRRRRRRKWRMEDGVWWSVMCVRQVRFWF